MEETEETATEPVEEGVGAIVMGQSGIQTKKSRRPRKQAAPKPIEDDKMLVYSDGNIQFQRVGSVKVGFNVVSKTAGAEYIKHRKVREATTEEVKEYYGL